MKSAKIKTIIQIVCYFLIVFIIGDFLVGKRRILAFFNRLFGKNKKEDKKMKLQLATNMKSMLYVLLMFPLAIRIRLV